MAEVEGGVNPANAACFVGQELANMSIPANRRAPVRHRNFPVLV